jgi:hypothetical protein
MFPTEKLALEDFSKDKMLQRGLCDKKNTNFDKNYQKFDI